MKTAVLAIWLIAVVLLALIVRAYEYKASGTSGQHMHYNPSARLDTSQVLDLRDCHGPKDCGYADNGSDH